MVKHLSDEQLKKLRLGGHDPVKVYAAYKAAVEHNGQPTVILARTIKGYGLGEAGEGRNITHQQKKMNEEDLRVVPHALRHPDLRRGDRRRAVLPSAGRQPRDASTCASGARRSAASCRRATVRVEPLNAPLDRALRGVLQGHRRPQGLDDDGVRAACCRSCCATRRSAS